MGALSFSSPLILISLLALPAIWLVLRATPPAPQRVRFPAFDLLRRLARTRETPERTLVARRDANGSRIDFAS